ncbi:MAG: tyrosine-type recombinase/integrase [Parvibaculaceae bacterium]
MPKVELTDRFCAKAKPGAGNVEYFDTVTTGLAFMVTPGGARTFYLAFTSPTDGKRARMKLGRYPEFSLATARKRAKEARGEIGAGNDPLREKRALEASQTVADLVENYIARHAMTKRSGPAIARRLRKNVKDVIGTVKLADLHRREITRCIDAVKDRGADVEANRVFEDIRAMVRWARGRGDLDENLVDGMRRPTETTERDRVLTPDEIKTVWKAFPGADMRESTRRILRLLLITLQRESEVAGMMKDELDLAKRLWTIPGARTKNKQEHVVPLSDMAVDIIREQIEAAAALAKRKGRKPPPFVFPAPGGRAAVTGASVPKAVKRLEVKAKGGPTIMGVAPWTPHDLRRTAATGMEELGISPFIVGHVINHRSITKSTVTSRVYARYTYDKEKREALDLWSDRLTGIIEGRAAVVPLAKAVA